MCTNKADINHNELIVSNIKFFGFDKEGLEINCDDSETIIWASSANFKIETVKTEHIAQLNKTNFVTKKSKHQQHQREAVRLLLHKLINFIPELSKQKDITLDESSFPYRLKPNGYYVSFTHSKNKVACAICTSQPVGIDTELNPVPIKTAKRFYNSNEMMWISELDNKDKQFALNLLWMLKEATVKRNSNNNLVTGLSSDLTNIAKHFLCFKNNRGENKIESTPLANQLSTSTLKSDSTLYILTQSLGDEMVLVI